MAHEPNWSYNLDTLMASTPIVGLLGLDPAKKHHVVVVDGRDIVITVNETDRISSGDAVLDLTWTPHDWRAKSLGRFLFGRSISERKAEAFLRTCARNLHAGIPISTEYFDKVWSTGILV